jgi:hypothetical protein
LAQHTQRTRHAKQHRVEAPGRKDKHWEKGAQAARGGSGEWWVGEYASETIRHTPAARTTQACTPGRPCTPSEPCKRRAGRSQHSLFRDAVVLEQHSAVCIDIGVRVLDLHGSGGRARIRVLN